MPCGCSSKLPKVREIINEPCPVLFLTLESPGTLDEDPATIGKYRNVLVVYKGSNARVLYDSMGIPTILTKDVDGTSDFELLLNRPKYMGELMTGDTDIPEVPEEISDDDYNNLWT